MLADKLAEYSDLIETALATADLEQVQDLTHSADLYLHKHLPLSDTNQVDIAELTAAMERLSSQFQAAMLLVEAARKDAHSQLQLLGKSKKNTNKYLDIARNFGS